MFEGAGGYGRLDVRHSGLPKERHSGIASQQMVHPCPHEMRGHGGGRQPGDGTYQSLVYGNDSRHSRETQHRDYGRVPVRFVGERTEHQQQHLDRLGVAGDQLPRTFAELLMYYPCCPLEAVVNIMEFVCNPYISYLDDNYRTIRVALRNWTAIIRRWSIDEFHEYYDNPKVKPYWNAYASSVDNKYYDVITSVDDLTTMTI